MPKIEISKKHAVELFTGLSFNDCAQWDGEKWGKRIAKLPALLSGPDALSTMVGNNTDSDIIKQVKEYRAAIKADPTTVFAIAAKAAVAPESVAAAADTKPKADKAAAADTKPKADKAVAPAKPAKVVEQRTIPEVEKAVKEAAKKAPAPVEKPKAKAAVEKKITKGVPYEKRFERLTEDASAFKATGGTDKFGFRKGTMAAQVNRYLSENPISTDKLFDKLKIVQRYRITDHMWKMRKLGFAASDATNSIHTLTAKGLKANFETDAPAPVKKEKKAKEVVKERTPEEIKASIKAKAQEVIDKAKKLDAKVAVKAEIKKATAVPAKKPSPLAVKAKVKVAPAAKKPAPTAKKVAVKAKAPVAKKSAPVKNKAGKKK